MRFKVALSAGGPPIGKEKGLKGASAFQPLAIRYSLFAIRYSLFAKRVAYIRFQFWVRQSTPMTQPCILRLLPASVALPE